MLKLAVELLKLRYKRAATIRKVIDKIYTDLRTANYQDLLINEYQIIVNEGFDECFFKGVWPSNDA